MHDSLILLVSIPVLGIAAQWLAWRLKAPSILLLLVFGLIAGPLTGWMNPDQLLGPILFPFISIAVAIILFEGGLSLRIDELKKIGTVVFNLASIGVLITWILATLSAWFFLKMPLSSALLLGAILTVTGPTVIAPILRSLRLSSNMSNVLKWEAMTNDPVGAILSVLIFEIILAGNLDQGPVLMCLGLLKTLFVGIGLGFVAGWLIGFLLKRYLVPEFLHSPVTLMFIIATYVGSNLLQPEAGLIAVTISGFYLANQKDITVKHIIEFKENLQVLLIACVFILLAARLELSFLKQINFSTFLFIFSLFFVIRPLVVFICTLKSNLHLNEKIFLSAMAPRGIVAAAVASIFAFELNHAGYDGGDQVLVMTFFVVMATVTIYGLSAQPLARALKITKPNPQGILIGGAQSWACQIGKAVKDAGFEVLLVDNNWMNVDRARHMGLRATPANILSEHLIDELTLAGIGKFLGLTPNDEVNSLASLHFAEIFGRSDVYQLVPPNHSRDDIGGAKTRLHGRFLFAEKLGYRELRKIFMDDAKIEEFHLTTDYDYEAFNKEFGERAVPLFVITDSGELKVLTIKNAPSIKEGQTLFALIQRAEKPS